jgi:hypothetical protein
MPTSEAQLRAWKAISDQIGEEETAQMRRDIGAELSAYLTDPETKREMQKGREIAERVLGSSTSAAPRPKPRLVVTEPPSARSLTAPRLRRRGAICIRQEPLTRSAASAMPPTAPAGAVRPDIELRGSNPMRASAYAT